jgi:hypothetical protein
MRKQHAFLGLLMVALMFTFTLNSCKKDNPTPLNLSTLVAGSIDLNGATSPTNVPTNPTITATFSTEVDQTTATNTNITLTEDYDSKVIPLTITVSGKTITIVPTTALANGALYKLAITADLKATNGLTLTNLNRSFTTVGTFVPTGQVAYWNFDGNANDQVGSYSPASASNVIAVTYSAGRSTAAGQAATFDGATSLVEIPNGDILMNTNDFTLSFWVKEDSTGRTDQFVMGLAGWYGFQFEINNNGNNKLGECKLAAQYSLSDGTTASQDLWFNGAATNTTKDNGGWKGWTYCKDLTSNNGTGVNGLLAEKWAQIICTYNSTTKVGTIYINGTEMKAQDFNLYGSDNALSLATGLKFAGNANNNSFVFGFIQDKNSPTITDSWADYTVTTNNHFKGQLDDVRIFHRALTDTEIQLMYNSEKP